MRRKIAGAGRLRYCTSIFQVGFDGGTLVGELDEALALLADEAGGGRRVRRRVFSRLARSGLHKPRRGPFPKWLEVGLLVLTVCHAIFQGGLYCKWFF